MAWNAMHDPYPRTAREYPPRDKPIWIMRDGWEKPSLTMLDELHPAMNAIGLYWAHSVDGEGPPDFPGKDGA